MRLHTHGMTIFVNFHVNFNRPLLLEMRYTVIPRLTSDPANEIFG